MEINKKLYSEIKDYCKENDLKITQFINDILQKAFNVEKFGDKPEFMNFKKNEVEKTKPTLVETTNVSNIVKQITIPPIINLPIKVVPNIDNGEVDEQVKITKRIIKSN